MEINPFQCSTKLCKGTMSVSSSGESRLGDCKVIRANAVDKDSIGCHETR